MIKSIFPQEMLSSNTLSLDSIGSKLSFFHLQAQLFHWQTFGGFEHAALGELYELLFEVKDEIIEKIMGYEGKRIKSFKLEPIKDYTLESSNSLVIQILEFALQLKEFGKMSNMTDIENIAQSLSGNVARIKYKLTLK